MGPLGGLLGSFGGILGVSWRRLGGLEVFLDAKLELDIVLYGFHFPGGPSWRRLGVVFEFGETILT